MSETDDKRQWDARTAEALRASEERYRLIVEGARDYAILTMDPEGRIESWSPGAEAVYGWTTEEAVGQLVHITFLPEERALGIPEEECAVARERGVAPDVRWHLRKDGARVFIEGMTRALRDDAGRLRGFLKVGQDVTQRRHTEDALRASESRYRVIVDHVRDYAIFLLDAAGVITEWTQGAERVKGYRADEVIGRHVSIFYPPEALAANDPAAELDEAARTGRAERESWRLRKGGERFWANEIATAVRDADGTLVGFTKITRDLTARRRDEEAAARQRAEVERDAMRRLLAAAEEEERRRLARELHDQLGQHLTALTLGLAEARGSARASRRRRASSSSSRSPTP
jgi:PAS domain S-box-containing protein